MLRNGALPGSGSLQGVLGLYGDEHHTQGLHAGLDQRGRRQAAIRLIQTLQHGTSLQEMQDRPFKDNVVSNDFIEHVHASTKILYGQRLKVMIHGGTFWAILPSNVAIAS